MYYTCTWNPRKCLNVIIWFILVNGTWKCIVKQGLNILIILNTTLVKKDNIYHQYFFKLSILLCGKNFLTSHSEYLFLPRYLNFWYFSWAAYFYIKLNSKRVYALSFLIHGYIFQLLANCYRLYQEMEINR